MHHQSRSSNNTLLKDRILWFDGDSTLTEDQIVHYRLTGTNTEGLYVDVVSDAIEHYNLNVGPEKRITTKEHVRDITVEWCIPEQYATLNVDVHVIELAYDYCTKRNWIKDVNGKLAVSIHGRGVMERVKQELHLYKKYNLFSLLRTLMFIINTFQANNVVWGVGRGSSVSSFVLYLLGVHDVDSVKYDLPIEDFLHD